MLPSHACHVCVHVIVCTCMWARAVACARACLRSWARRQPLCNPLSRSLQSGRTLHVGSRRKMLESPVFPRFFDKVEVANFEIASDAFSTFKARAVACVCARLRAHVCGHASVHACSGIAGARMQRATLAQGGGLQASWLDRARRQGRRDMQAGAAPRALCPGLGGGCREHPHACSRGHLCPEGAACVSLRDCICCQGLLARRVLQ